jgi:hypothetical protein
LLAFFSGSRYTDAVTVTVWMKEENAQCCVIREIAAESLDLCGISLFCFTGNFVLSESHLS